MNRIKTHRFNPQNAHRLDNRQRRRKLPPAKILRQAGITKGCRVADIGCGIGYFTVPAAKIVGNTGTVYAFDVSSAMIRACKERTAGLKNIFVIRSRNDIFRIPAGGTVDFVLLSFLLHEIENTRFFLSTIRTILSEKGRIVLIDWQKKKTSGGPPAAERLSFRETVRILSENGFTSIQRLPIHPDFYFLIARSRVRK